jgi:uncharacterized protein
MSRPWSNSLDIERLADAHADIDFSVPVRDLSRLDRFEGIAGSVAGHVRLERVSGLPVAELSLQGTVQLTCQRCLGPLTVPVDRQVRIGLIESEEGVSRVPEDLEPVLAPGGRTSIGALVEEELLLSLPIVPQHAQGEPCADERPVPAEADTDAPQVNRPFADLGELLNRK